MTAVSKFLFDNDFDGAAESAAERAKARPRYTEGDLAAARGEGQQAGFEMGRAQARQEIEAQVAASLESLADALGPLVRAHGDAVRRIEADGIELAIGAARRLARQLVASRPDVEIEGLLRQCLAELPQEPRFVLRIADALVEPFREIVESLPARAGFEGAIVLIGEPALAPGDCRIEWADGGTERDAGALDARIQDLVARYCETLRAPPPQPEPEPAAPTGGDAPKDEAEAEASPAPAEQTDDANPWTGDELPSLPARPELS